MSPAISETRAVKLSICIATLDRAGLIAETLDSMLVQATDDCEVLILDSGCSHDTERVVSEYMRRYDCLRYVRQGTNNGIDRDYDRVVELARGEYCWLMTDDDLLRPGAVAAVLEAPSQDLSLIIVNSEHRDAEMSTVLRSRWLPFETDRLYGTEEMDELFMELGSWMTYIGCVVIRRAVWLARERTRYYGSLFIHVGVIFQQPLIGKALVMAKPLVSVRRGNAHSFSRRMFEIFMVNWPSVVWSLSISESAKLTTCTPEPWRDLYGLLLWRGWGYYSLAEYRKWIRPRLCSLREKLAFTIVAVCPGALINAIFVLYYSATRRSYRTLFQGVLPAEELLMLLRESRFHIRNWSVFRRAS